MWLRLQIELLPVAMLPSPHNDFFGGCHLTHGSLLLYLITKFLWLMNTQICFVTRDQFRCCLPKAIIIPGTLCEQLHFYHVQPSETPVHFRRMIASGNSDWIQEIPKMSTLLPCHFYSLVLCRNLFSDFFSQTQHLKLLSKTASIKTTCLLNIPSDPRSGGSASNSKN